MEMLIEVLPARLLATSVQTLVLVALVWTLCRGLKRLPAATQCALWWLVAAQATLGLFWANPLQLPLLPAIPAAAATTAAAATAAAPVLELAPALAAAVPDAPATAPVWPLLLLAAWLSGVLLMTVRTGLAWRASRRLLQGSQPCTDASLVAALRLAAHAHGLRRPPQLRISTQISSPQLIGLWAPTVLLPARPLSTMADDDLDMALTHELVHLRRRDLWWGLLPALAQHLFFFHPLVHLATREYAVAREAAVDAEVVAGNRHCRHDYGRLLLRLGVATHPTAGLASASPTFLSLKRRLLMLQNTGSFPRIGATLILAVVAFVGVMPLRLVAMPTPPTPPSPPPAPPAPPVVDANPVRISADGRSVVIPAPRQAVVAAPALPAVPARPAAPAGALKTQGVIHLSSDSHRDSYVLLKGDYNVMDGSVDDLQQARQLDDGNGVMLLRRDGKRYVVRDPATLARFQQLYAETRRLGDAQGKLGDEQGKLGSRQGEIGARMGELGARIGASASRQAQLALSTDSDAQQLRKEAEDARREAEQARAELDNPVLREELRSLARQQVELGRQQAELGRQQAAASAQARQEADRIIQQAIRDGIARPFSG